MLDRVRQHALVAARGLRRSPGFTLIAAATIALGIGAATAIFSVVDAAFLRALPYIAGDRLVAITETRKGDEISVAFPDLLDWRARNRSFTEVAGFVGSSVSLSGGDGAPERIRGEVITPNLFHLLGVSVARGREFSDAEAGWGGPRVVILSDGLWKRRFGADPSIVGRTISIDRAPYDVVGVMPAGFDFPGGIVYGASDLWMPSGTAPQSDWMNRDSHPGLAVIGRLRDGATAKSAQRDMDAISASLAAEYPREHNDEGVKVRGALDSIVGDLVPGFSLVGAAALLLLLIASANVAGLLLARTMGRYREVAIRTALGATRADIAAQILAESVMLGLIGGSGGIVLAWAAVHAAGPLFEGIPRSGGIRIDWLVVVVAIALSIVTSILFGLAPALAASGGRIAALMTERGRTGGPRGARVRRMLVAGEMATAVVLVVCAAMLARSFANMTRETGGIEPDGVLTFEVRLPASAYVDDSRIAAFYRELTARVSRLPGATSVGAISTLPFSGGGAQSGIQALDAGSEPVRTDVAAVTPGYFSAMGVQLLYGRGLLNSDEASASPVAVVDDQFAKHFWTNASDAIGKQISGWGFQALTVVGVVRHVKNYGVTAVSRQELFVAHAQHPNTRMIYAVRTTGDPARVTKSVREIVSAMDAQLPVYNVRTMRDVVNGTVSAPRLATTVSSVLAALALALAAVGLYGVIAFSVGQRRREIGVRMALGASSHAILGNVLRDAVVLAFAGIAAGLATALGAATLLRSQLFGVSSTDPVSFTVTCAVFATVTLLASALPAWRASRLSPTEALRDS